MNRLYDPLIPAAAMPLVTLRVSLATARAIPLAPDPAIGPAMIRFDKAKGGRIAAAINRDWLTGHRRHFTLTWRRAAVFADLVADKAVPAGSYLCALGDAVGPAGRVLGFCSNHAETVLVPDRGFYLKAGYAAERRAAAMAPAWNDRRDGFAWRGSPTGIGRFDAAAIDAGGDDLIQRARLCLAARTIADADIKFAAGSLRHDPAIAAACARAGIAAAGIPQADWMRRRYAIDIDGNSNAFSNLFIRLIYGCCVVKVASPFAYRQWYYDRLRPWDHFVPVAADLSDLEERLAWCRANPAASADIAAKGQRLALSMTFPAERSATVARISAAFP